MARSVIAIFVLLAVTVISGCAFLVVGAGAGAGVFTYIKGELTRTYAADFERTESATIKSLNHLKITIDEKTHINDQTTITAHQTDGSPVTVKIRTASQDKTEVAVRCGRIGYWNRKNAELVHATILNTI